MNRDALVVGINQYPLLKKNLTTPASDAEAIARRLEEYGGFRVRRLPEMLGDDQRQIDPKNSVSLETLQDAIIQLFNPTNPIETNVPRTALLYFSGHGMRQNLGGVTDGFLAPSNVNPQRNQWGISLEWLRKLLQISPVGEQIVWLDCCYSGELLNFSEADLGTTDEERTRFFIAAAREFEVAEGIEGQHSLFSRALWKGLDPRRQSDSAVNNDRLIEYISQRLKDTPQQPIWYNPIREILLTGERAQTLLPTVEGICPYKGLYFFDVADAPYFYGREGLTEQLIQRVQVGKENFLAVLGVSGSGKSSLLRAGLIYQLQQEQRLPETQQWKVRIFTPGEEPLASLATAFLDEDVTDIERAEQLKVAEVAIQEGATGLARLIRASKSPRTVLIVDQFEETFAVCKNQTEREQFIKALVGALETTGDKLCLILAMRDDFLGKCATYRQLAALIQANLIMVTPMNLPELRQAIVEPATKLGRKVEENLVNAILKDLGVEGEPQAREPEPGMLPLLEYTLEQLWYRQRLNWLKLDSYNQLGGVQKTLENLAEETYQQLSAEEQPIADWIFIKLTQLGEGTPDTRKQVAREDLVAQGQTAEFVEQVIHKLAAAKLIVTSEQRKGQEKVAVVDVAHEALIRHWARLRELLDNNREAIRTERKIQAAAEEWREKGKAKDYLLTGLRLGEAKRFAEYEAKNLSLSVLAREFVQKSVAQKRINQRFRFGAVAIFIGGLTLAAIISLIQRQIAINQSRISHARLLAAQSQLIKDQQVNLIARSVLLAIEAIQRYPSMETDRAFRSGLSLLPKEAKYNYAHSGSVNNVLFSPDGRYLATVSNESKNSENAETGEILKIWDINGNKEVFSVSFQSIRNIIFTADGRFLAIDVKDSTQEEGIKVFDFSKKAETYHIKTEGEIEYLVFSEKQEKLLAVGTREGSIQVYSINNKKMVDRYQEYFSGTDLSFDENISSIGSDQAVKLLDINNTSNNTNISVKGEINNIAFSQNGQYLAISYLERSDNTNEPTTIVKIFNAKTGRSINQTKYKETTSNLKFSPDSKYVVVSTGYGSESGVQVEYMTNILEVLTGREVARLNRNANAVAKLSFSPDSKYVAAKSKDTQVWELATGKEVIRFQPDENVNNIAFSPDGQYLATGSSDGRAKIIKLPNQAMLDEAYKIFLSPKGKYIARVEKDDTASVWIKNDNKKILSLKDIDSIVFDRKEELLAIEDKHSSIRVLKISDKKEVFKFKLEASMHMMPFFFENSSNLLFLETNENLISIFDIKTKKRFDINFKKDTNLSFTANEKYLAAVLISYEPLRAWVEVWDILNKKKMYQLRHNYDPKFPVYKFGSISGIDKKNRFLLTGIYNDKDIILWSLEKGKKLTKFAHNALVEKAIFIPQTKYIATVGNDSTARIWEMFTGREIFRLQHDDIEVWDIDATFNGKYIATAGGDNTARVWEVSTGKEVIRLQHNQPVNYVRFSPDGKYLVTFDTGNTSRVWLLHSEDLISEACNRLTRNLTLEEWKQYFPDEPYRQTCHNLPLASSTIDAE